ncbi:MAG: hypothetical protein PUF12_06080 [Thermoflexaceae bacterium]|nr:hypothetical protein [Thermoflexaceae bacterium]
MNSLNIEMNAVICNIVRQYLTQKQIEENYQKACKEVLPQGADYDNFLMEKVVKRCRQMAFCKIPKTAFSKGQLLFIKNEWGIDVYK